MKQKMQGLHDCTKTNQKRESGKTLLNSVNTLVIPVHQTPCRSRSR